MSGCYFVLFNYRIQLYFRVSSNEFFESDFTAGRTDQEIF